MIADNSLFTKRPLIAVASANPDDPARIAAPNQFTGVVQYTDVFTTCTGVLLPTGRHILTVAHCFNPEKLANPNRYLVSFDLPSGPINLPVSRIWSHPEWSAFTGSSDARFGNGNDIAILELAETAPPEVERYPIYRDFNEVGQVFTKVGYGLKGTGQSGEIIGTVGTKKFGANRYDTLADSLNFRSFNSFANGKILFYDFDNGLPANDAFGQILGIRDLGLGLEEVGPTQGDSGAPSFINGKIASLTSFAEQPSIYGFPNVDIDDDNRFTTFNDANSSFGELFAETRVAAYTNWIEQVIIDSSDGNDRLSGTFGNDTLSGYRANDNISGLSGDDLLFGAKGFDTIVGGDGNDTLIGDRGQDLLTGGNGNDLFVLSNIGAFNDPNLADLITDFNLSTDRLGLADGLTTNNLILVPYNLNGSNGTLISLATENNSIAFVIGITPQQLSDKFLPVSLNHVSLI